ncbi:MAG: TetR/AcrR family transcriptional regulator [Pseudomonadota bacterium]
MVPGQPKWRRRKEARPAEIVAAALEVFAERGFAAARLDDIAARAGVSKGALYLYFETKQELFNAVVRDAVTPNIEAVEAGARNLDLPFGALARMLVVRAADLAVATRLAAVAKMVIGESGNFPELASVWHDAFVGPMLGVVSGVIERAQARGEVKPGDPRVHAFSMMGALMMGVLWREVLEPAGAPRIDLRALAVQHAETALAGMLTEGGRA